MRCSCLESLFTLIWHFICRVDHHFVSFFFLKFLLVFWRLSFGKSIATNGGSSSCEEYVYATELLYSDDSKSWFDASELVVLPHLFFYPILLSEDLLLSYSSSFDDFIFLRYFQPSMIFFLSRNSLFLSVVLKSKYGHTSIMEICNIRYYFAYNFSLQVADWWKRIDKSFLYDER